MMKTHLLPIVFLACLVISCQKEPSVPIVELQHGTLSLTADEMVRLPLFMHSKSRTPQDVLQVVERRASSVGSRSSNLQIVDSLVFGQLSRSSEDPIVIYVVNSSTGFTLVNKDVRLNPIIGYSDGEQWSDTPNPGFEITMEVVAAQQKYLRDSIEKLRGDAVFDALGQKMGIIKPCSKVHPVIGPDDPPVGPNVPWTRYELVNDQFYTTEFLYGFGPLLTTEWGQGYPFNSKLHGYPAGCMATAVAQIMAYHKWPVDTTYKWDLFQSKGPGVTWSSVAIESVSTLFSTLGLNVNLDMNYASTGSTTSFDKACRTFINFGYQNGGHIVDFNHHDLWSEISSGYPTLICGLNENATEGHAWVIDGDVNYRIVQKCYTYFYNGNELVYILTNEPQIIGYTYYFHQNYGMDGDKNTWLDEYTWDAYDVKCKYNLQLIVGIRK